MSDSVQFEEQRRANSLPSAPSDPWFIRLIVRSGVTQDRSKANQIALFAAFILIACAMLLFFIGRNDADAIPKEAIEQFRQDIY